MRVLIVEDEPLIAQRLERFCREILGSKLEAIRVATLLTEASARLDELPIDLLLLDLNLHGRDGMSLLETSVAGSFHTIIVSANTEQALRAFEFGVMDFVPKPFSKERLAQALARVTERVGRAAGAAKFLAVKKARKVELVPIDRVTYVEGAGAYAELVLDDGKRELHDKTLEKVHALLPAGFERIQKSYVVRWSAVKALHAQEGSHYERSCATANGSRSGAHVTRNSGRNSAERPLGQFAIRARVRCKVSEPNKARLGRGPGGEVVEI